MFTSKAKSDFFSQHWDLESKCLTFAFHFLSNSVGTRTERTIPCVQTWETIIMKEFHFFLFIAMIFYGRKIAKIQFFFLVWVEMCMKMTKYMGDYSWYDPIKIDCGRCVGCSRSDRVICKFQLNRVCVI